MRRWWIALFGLPVIVAIYGCKTPEPKSNICPVLDAGPPPVCPEGCYWDKDDKQCRGHSGIIVEDMKDGGAN